MKKICCIYAISLFFLQQAVGQTQAYHVQVINHSNLVAPGDVLQVMKDDNGYLWLMLPNKLQRYDGKDFVSFSFDDRCINIAQDASGSIWLATRQAIYRFKNDYSGFEKLKEYSGETDQYLALQAGPEKNIFLLKKKAILQWNINTQLFDSLSIGISTTGSSFHFLQSNSKYLIYKKSETALARYNFNNGIIDSVRVTKSNFVFPINEDSVWVRQDIGSSVLVSFKNKSITEINARQFAMQFGDSRFFVTGSTPDLSFVCFESKGYFSYDKRARKFTKINLLHNGLPIEGGTPVYSFYNEANGGIWFTNEQGLVYINPHKATIGLIRSNAAAGENWNNNVKNITEDDEGNIWFATANGFCRIDKKSGTVKTWQSKFESGNYLNYPSVRSIGYSNDKIIIGQSEKGFWIFNPKTEIFTRPVFDSDSLQRQFEAGFNSNMIQLRNGNFLILSQRVWIMDKDSFKIKEIKFNGFEPIPRTAYEDAQGRIWMVGRGGVFCTNANFKLLYSIGNPEIKRWANAIVQIDENTFWVAAKNLFEIKLSSVALPNLLTLFPKLKNTHISHLYKDKLNNIWMFADNGIYRYLLKKKVLEKFDRNDNAQAYQVSITNSFYSKEGLLYAGSTNGINYFNAEKIPQQNDSLQIMLTNVIVNADDSTFLQQYTFPKLSYRQNSIQFQFVAPYIYNGDKVQYRCRLQGADGEWIYIGNDNSIRYTSLKPGHYVFYSSASLNGKKWYENNTSFSFTILPPFWQKGWFILLILFFIAALAFIAVKRRINYIRKRETEKTELQKIKAISYQAQLETEQIINYFANSISMQTTVDDMLWDLAKNLIGKLGFEDCMIYLWNKDKTVLIQQSGFGVKGSMQTAVDKSAYNIPKGKGIVGATVENCHYILANDTSLDKRYFTADEKIRLSELCVPIVHNNEAIGAINTEHSEKNFFTVRHLQILITIASMLADKIDILDAQRQNREQEIKVLKMNEDLAVSQLTSLRAQMNPHFIFNAMNSIQQFTLKNDVDNANLYISRFSTLLRKVLQSSQHNLITLEEEITLLNLYLDIEKLRLGSNFVYTIKADDEIEPDAVKIPGMLLQPFVENALKHGLALKEGNKILNIQFLLGMQQQLIVTITDNGIGIKKAGEIKKQNDKMLPHQSSGIRFVKERLQLLHPTGVTGFLQIKDLYDDDNQPCGTSVSLQIPLSANAS